MDIQRFYQEQYLSNKDFRVIADMLKYNQEYKTVFTQHTIGLARHTIAKNLVKLGSEAMHKYAEHISGQSKSVQTPAAKPVQPAPKPYQPAQRKKRRTDAQKAADARRRYEAIRARLDMIEHVQNSLDNQDITVDEFLADPAVYMRSDIMRSYYKSCIVRQ